ncbi:MAG: PTS lactose/cellobiose transporter subunit IIA [Coprobacillaceae bacterium]
MNEQEKQIMAIISGSGDSKAKAFEALKKVKENDYEGARKLLEEAKHADLQVHKTQTELIQAELSEGEEKPIVNLLMVHAQDHYMTSQLARDLIETLIDIFETKEGK